MMKEALNSLGATLYERSTSPFIGGFVVSWSIINFAFWLTFFSELAIENKVQALNLYLNERSLSALIWLPLLATLLYLLVYPYVLNVLSCLTLHAKKQSNDLLGRHADATYIKASEYETYKREARQEIVDKENIISRKEQQIKELTQSISDLNGQIEGMNSDIATLETNNKTYQRQLRQYLDDKQLTHLQRVHDMEELKKIGGTTDNLRDGHTLLTSEFVFYFNPNSSLEKMKPMKFSNGGAIASGWNESEGSWRIHEGRFEFLDSNGYVHNRFDFDADRLVLRSTNDNDVGALKKDGVKDQFLAFSDGSSDLSPFG